MKPHLPAAMHLTCSLPMLLALLALAPAATSCRKATVIRSSTLTVTPDTLIAGTVIRAAGTWTASDAKGSRKLDVTVSGTTVSWSVESMEKHPGGGSSGGSSTSGMTLSSPADPWFIFVESPERLWFFNGKDGLTYALSDGGGSRSGPAIFSGQLQPTNEVIPAELAALLPADLQKVLPPSTTPSQRPSF